MATKKKKKQQLPLVLAAAFVVVLGLGFLLGYAIGRTQGDCKNPISYYAKDGESLLYQDCSSY